MTDSPISERTDRIRQLNDRVRMLKTNGNIHWAGSLAQEPFDLRMKVLDAVAVFNAFNDGDDPYGEHDFGMVTVDGEGYYFKIDYYDPTMEYGSDDPADPAKTVRVMTLMHTSDY